MSAARGAAIVRDAFLVACEEAGGLHACMSRLDLPGSAGKRLHRPLFAPKEDLAQVGADVQALVQLMSATYRRHYGSVDSFLTAQAVSPQMRQLVELGSVGDTPLHVRADVLCSDSEFRIVEINIGTGLAGIDIAKVNRSLLSQPAFAEFAERHGLGFTDVAAIVAEQLRTIAATVTGSAEPIVGVVEETGSGSPCLRYAEELRRYGLQTLHGEICDLGEKNGRITVRGVAVDVVFRCFFARHLLTEADGIETLRMLADAHRQGRTALFTPLDNDLFERKSALALLREPSIWAGLSPAERDLVDRRIPWMRLLASTPQGQPSADRRDVLEQARAHREDMVLKPSDANRGSGVVFGADVGDREWAELLRAADNHVVQRRVRPEEEPMVDPDDGVVRPWHINWGVFATDAGYAGVYARGRDAAANGVIGGGSHSRRGCVFTY